MELSYLLLRETLISHDFIQVSLFVMPDSFVLEAVKTPIKEHSNLFLFYVLYLRHVSRLAPCESWVYIISE